MEQQRIGKFILELRKEKNMTQKDLADQLGVTDRAISKWENGRGMPDDALRIASVSGISATPDEEWECSFGTQGDPIYQWTANGKTYLGVQVIDDKAYGISVD